LTEYLTEQEQIEILKNWIKQYSFVILAGVLIAALTISSWRYYQRRQDKILYRASAIHDEMLIKRAQGDQAGTLAQAKKLFSHYPKTAYGQVAAFMLAREAIVKKDFHQAEKHFQWIIDNSNIAAFRQIARIRYARIMLSQKQPDKSIDLLKKVEDKNYAGLIDEVRGDAFLAKNDVSMAREAYQLALSELPNAEVTRPLLQMKYDNLAPGPLSKI
jgi:predicted negative regulator of RcsB-dependent stress response